MRRERAQYAADLARRRFLALAPEHRLGARTLERDWNEQLTDSQIALTLNRAGAHAGLGGSLTGSKVAWIRSASTIPAGCPEAPGACPTGQRGDGRYAARAAAALLNVDVRTIADWCRAGQLEYVQPTPHSPRWVTLTPERMAALRKPVRQRNPRRARQG